MPWGARGVVDSLQYPHEVLTHGMVRYVASCSAASPLVYPVPRFFIAESDSVADKVAIAGRTAMRVRVVAFPMVGTFAREERRGRNGGESGGACGGEIDTR